MLAASCLPYCQYLSVSKFNLSFLQTLLHLLSFWSHQPNVPMFFFAVSCIIYVWINQYAKESQKLYKNFPALGNPTYNFCWRRYVSWLWALTLYSNHCWSCTLSDFPTVSVDIYQLFACLHRWFISLRSDPNVTKLLSAHFKGKTIYIQQKVFHQRSIPLSSFRFECRKLDHMISNISVEMEGTF